MVEVVSSNLTWRLTFFTQYLFPDFIWRTFFARFYAVSVVGDKIMRFHQELVLLHLNVVYTMQFKADSGVHYL